MNNKMIITKKLNVLYMYGGYLREHIIDEFNAISKVCNFKVIFYRENAKNPDFNKLEFNYVVLNYYTFLSKFKFAPKVIKKLITEKYDILVFPEMGTSRIIESLSCFLISKIRKKPYIVVTEHWWLGKRKKNKLKQIILSLLDFTTKIIFLNASACIAYSTKAKERYIHLGVNKEKIFVTPYVSMLNFKGNIKDAILKVKKELDLKNKKVILFVGRLVEYKGLDYLIEAIKKLKDEKYKLRLIVVGGEDLTFGEKTDRDYFENLCLDLGLKLKEDVCFVGRVPHNELKPYFMLCNVFVLPTTAQKTGDGWGLVVNEAMSCSKPVIVSNVVGSAYDLVKNGVNGFIVQESSPDALANAIKKIISTDAIEKRMGLASKKIIKNFTPENSIKGFVESVKFALNKKKEK